MRPASRFVTGAMFSLVVFGMCSTAPAARPKARTRPATAAPAGPSPASIEDVLACKIDAFAWMGWNMSLDATKARYGMTPVTSADFAANTYRLARPITVAGYQTSAVMLSSDALLAVLDVADPSALIKNAGMAGSGAAERQAMIRQMIAEMDKAHASAAQRDEMVKEMSRPGPTRAERVVSENPDKAIPGSSIRYHTRVAKVIRTMEALPGKTLYGCSYSAEAN